VHLSELERALNAQPSYFRQIYCKLRTLFKDKLTQKRIVVKLLGRLFRKLSTSKKAIKPKQDLVNLCLNRGSPPVPPRSRADTLSTVNTMQETHVPMELDDEDDNAKQSRNSGSVVLNNEDMSRPIVIDDSDLMYFSDTAGKLQQAL
jgi:hypothetical protein